MWKGNARKSITSLETERNLGRGAVQHQKQRTQETLGTLEVFDRCGLLISV
jgi:hypothetical protein